MVVTALSVLALSAVGAGPAPAVSPDPGLTLRELSTPVGIDIDPVDGSVYVANASGGAAHMVSVFDARTATPNHARTLIDVDPVAGAWDVAVNPIDRWVYVSSPDHNEVLAYRPGTTTPNDSYTLSIDHPAGLDFRADGAYLFVTAYDSDKVVAYRRGEYGQYEFVTSLATLDRPTDVAVNPALGGVYVTTQAGAVQYFDHYMPPPIAGRALLGAASAWSVAFNPAGGQMYVTDPASDVVRSYPVGIVTPDASGELTGSPDAAGVAVHPTSGQVYVSDAGANEVRVYPPPTPTITSVLPAAGLLTGGTAVCVDGTNLALVASLVFGGTATSDFTAPNTYTRTCVRTPAVSTAGLVDVSVRWSAASATLPGGFTYQPVAPGPATGVTVTPGNGRVDVTWAAPVFTGGVPVQSYLVTPSPGGAPCSTTERDCTISGLTNGQKYTFAVTTTNTAGLTSVSAPSAEVKPYVPVKQTVKAKKASSKVPRKGYATVVNWVKKPKYASLQATMSCYVPPEYPGAGLPSTQLCKFTQYKTGKVKVRTKGYRNVRVQVTVQSVPKAGAPVQYGPSTAWTRTWKVR